MKTVKNKILLFGIILTISILVDGCKKTENTENTRESISDVQTIRLDVRINSAEFRATVSFTGSITDMGICWSTETNPTVDDNKISHGASTSQSGMDFFDSNITVFNHNTKYYVRAYASNIDSTVYGNTKTFEVQVGPGENIIDIDGNTYTTAIIGTQTWMAENLKVTHFTNNNSIFFVGDDPHEWILHGSRPNYAYYNNNPNNSEIYGLLYNQASIERDEICPSGWHVPTYDDWETLQDFLHGWFEAGGKLKETGTTHWQSPNLGATNESGFNALPGGMRIHNGYFSELGERTYYWSIWRLGTFRGGFSSVPYSGKMMVLTEGETWSGYGYSIRCIKH
ncbi:MAG: fibrobacter succinogenes major paralogous domain-containing protein [Lutibacter sp.]|jgi:uncharacterized protein (TIGR02145 family)